MRCKRYPKLAYLRWHTIFDKTCILQIIPTPDSNFYMSRTIIVDAQLVNSFFDISNLMSKSRFEYYPVYAMKGNRFKMEKKIKSWVGRSSFKELTMFQSAVMQCIHCISSFTWWWSTLHYLCMSNKQYWNYRYYVTNSALNNYSFTSNNLYDYKIIN